MTNPNLEEIYDDVATANPHVSEDRLTLLFVRAIVEDDSALHAFLDEIHKEIVFERNQRN